MASLALRQTGGGEGPQEIPSCWQLGPATQGTPEAFVCVMRLPQALLAPKAAAGFSHGPQAPGPGGRVQPQWRSWTLDAEFGTWEPEAAELQARVLTNGFETCLLRPRDQPLAEGKFPARLAVFWWPPPSSLFLPSPFRTGLRPWGYGMR